MPRLSSSLICQPLMKNDITILQLKTLIAICDNDLNVTAAAAQLNMTQPSVSKQLLSLEGIIGKPLFFRNGKRLQYETDACRDFVSVARDILLKCDNLAAISAKGTDVAGALSVGTTHTQARYVLPTVLEEFRAEYPNIAVNITQGAPVELVRLLNGGRVDLLICTESLEANNSLKTIASFSWNRCLIAPARHPLMTMKSVSLQALEKHAIVTYVGGFTGRGAFDGAFARAGLSPRVMVSAADADVIKTYVRMGFGVGVIAEMAYEQERDGDLAMRSLRHLFPEMTVRLAYQRGKYVSASMQHFIQLFQSRTRRT